jgi:hypothetical protein
MWSVGGVPGGAGGGGERLPSRTSNTPSLDSFSAPYALRGGALDDQSDNPNAVKPQHVPDFSSLLQMGQALSNGTSFLSLSNGLGGLIGVGDNPTSSLMVQSLSTKSSRASSPAPTLSNGAGFNVGASMATQAQAQAQAQAMGMGMLGLQQMQMPTMSGFQHMQTMGGIHLPSVQQAQLQHMQQLQQIQQAQIMQMQLQQEKIANNKRKRDAMEVCVCVKVCLSFFFLFLAICSPRMNH